MISILISNDFTFECFLRKINNYMRLSSCFIYIFLKVKATFQVLSTFLYFNISFVEIFLVFEIKPICKEGGALTLMGTIQAESSNIYINLT